MFEEEKLQLTDAWDKTFPKSEKVNHKKVTFHNRYGITLAGDLYTPKNYSGKLAAIALCGPFGAVKEQASGYYAQTLAERGFLTMAFDPSFTGESGGKVRNVMSADLSTEDFQAAVDFLSVQDNVDPEKIGILGICGWGGMALNVAALDTRVKATVVSTMYDMTRLTRGGYFDSENTPGQRYAKKKALNAQRTEDYRKGTYARNGGLPEKAPDDAPQFLKDYVSYYRGRAYHPRAVNPNGGWNTTSDLGLLSMPILQYSEEIQSAVLMIHGEKAHSLYFGKEAFSHLRGANKEFLLIPGASHTDLYDTDKIPFDKIVAFYRRYLR
jgi:fermentation-respiration switch protein FrsA (DUF1100 family)